MSSYVIRIDWTGETNDIKIFANKFDHFKHPQKKKSDIIRSRENSNL